MLTLPSVRRRLFILWTFATTTALCAAQSVPHRLPADHLDGPPAAEVLILGTYHMGNPGRDIVNLKADDVLAPKRQTDMRELLDTLAKFQPNKIALEASPDDETMTLKRYDDFLAGKYEIGRNEREQIGYRLAKELHHPKIYGIDIEGDFPYARVQDYAKAHGRDKELESLMGNVETMVREDNEYLLSHSILQMLVRINSDEAVRRSLAGYAMFAHFGEADDYAGGELLTQWYNRNVRIHTHLLQILEPGDRVLVIYGSGHLGLLRQDVQADPTLKLRTLSEFAGTAK